MRHLLSICWIFVTCYCCSVFAADSIILESTCQAGRLVDADFRDAAIDVLEQLAIDAPGRSAHGAIRAHLSPGHVDGKGNGWHLVSAYQVNLGWMGALSVAPDLLPLAAQWLRWQARHSSVNGPNRGIVLDHWIRANDLEENLCPPGLAQEKCSHVDAFDSTAASVLLMADAYLRQGGNRAVLREPLVRQLLEGSATVLRELTSAIGLTYDKPTRRIIYTMDAAEVLAGLHAWARLQRDAYAQPQSGKNTLMAAKLGSANMTTHLWDADSSSWQVSLGAGSPQLGRWYPDTVAQAWPLLWGTYTEVPARARLAWRRSISRWQGSPHWARQNADPDGFWWPAIAVAALCTGDDSGARTWVARARHRWMNPTDPFPWPFQVGDLLWLFWLAEPVHPP